MTPSRKVPPSGLIPFCRICTLFSQNLLHGLALVPPIHQLVEIPNILHQRVFNQLHFDAADTALDQLADGIQDRSVAEEIPVGRIAYQQSFDLLMGVACESGSHFQNFFSGSALAMSMG
jgi:hypothetical protein